VKTISKFVLVLVVCALGGCPCPEAAVLRDSSGTALRLYEPISQNHEKLLDEKSGYSPQDIQGIKAGIAKLKQLLLKMSQDK